MLTFLLPNEHVGMETVHFGDNIFPKGNSSSLGQVVLTLSSTAVAPLGGNVLPSKCLLHGPNGLFTVNHLFISLNFEVEVIRKAMQLPFTL